MVEVGLREVEGSEERKKTIKDRIAAKMKVLLVTNNNVKRHEAAAATVKYKELATKETKHLCEEAMDLLDQNIDEIRRR